MSSQEQPEDQPPTDDTAEDEPDDDDSPPTDDERIEQITERIGKARTRAEEAGILDDTDDDDTDDDDTDDDDTDDDDTDDKAYVESGATEEEDDQTITPPG